LAKSEVATLRRAAKQITLEAYLGAARDIGLGRWQQKAPVVSRWLDAAMAVADDLIRHEQGGAETRLAVYEAALAALAGIAEPPDPKNWIDGTKQLGAVLIPQSADEGYRAHLAWRLGIALADATEIETARGHGPQALELGNLALAYFGLGEAAGQKLPLHDYLRGWLCYRIGAIHALDHGDHPQAVAWFRQAVPLLESPAPPSAAVHPARHGETFIGMAVSHWELGDRKEAVRLTEQGLKLMERAAADGQLHKAALAVPYGNLARMHQTLGNDQAARQFENLAARAEALAPN
jgi:tetratricopeptide (TPR) repeat protein